MQVRVTPKGIMDKDTELVSLREGNYPDANGIRFRTVDGNLSTAPSNIKGNALGFSIPDSPLSQTKKYRVYIDISKYMPDNFVSQAVEGTITCHDGGVTDSNTFFIGVSTLAAFYTSITAELDLLTFSGTYTTPFTYSALTTIDSSHGYFDLTPNEIVDQDFFFTYVGDPFFSLLIIDEYLSASGNRSMKIVGSEKIGTDLIITSASRAIYGGKTMSEIGVASYNEDTGAYTYTRLLRSTQLGFSWDYQTEIKLELNGNRLSVYLTDTNSKPRCFYFDKPYSEDCGLISNGGEYSHDTIDSESYLFLQEPNAIISLVEVVDGGGVLTAGNKRYTGRFLTDSLSPTGFVFPTNPIPVYIGSPDQPWEITGGQEGQLTNKGIKLRVDNIPPGVFKYFELAVIEYVGESFTTKLVQRYPLENETYLDVSHTDLGQDNAELSVTELLAAYAKYDKITCIELFGNRLFAGGVEEESDLDLDAWAQDITHSLERKSLTSVGTYGDLTVSNPSYRSGEFLDPANVCSFTSYMFNDTYRFGIQVQSKRTGKWSSGYWVDDIRFDTETDNVIGTRRTANNINPNFTDVDTTETYVYYVKFGNIDLEYLVDGTPLRELIGAYRFVRAERVPEVIATGVFMYGNDNGTGEIVSYDYPHNGTSYPSGGSPDSSDHLFFYSPDIYLGKRRYQFQTGDSLKLMGSFSLAGGQNLVTLKSSLATLNSTFGDYTGHFDTDGSLGLEFTDVAISNHATLDSINEITVGASTVKSWWTGRKTTASDVFIVGATQFGNLGTVQMKADDTGLVYGQIFRDLGANLKYPSNKELTQYFSTGHIRVLTGETGILEDDVYGGDVYNQKTFMHYYQSTWYTTLAGANGAFGFYSQNVCNTQLRAISKDENIRSGFTGWGYLWPQYVIKENGSTYTSGTCGSGLAGWVEQWPEVTNQRLYNHGYDYKDVIFANAAYDANAQDTKVKPCRIVWTPTKAVGSQKDNYRVFRPADFFDLDSTKGDLVRIMDINGALYTWQPQSFQRQFAGQATFLQAEGSQVIAGAGNIFGTKGVELSAIGSWKKWSVFTGMNPNGKTTAYWYNDMSRKIVRFAGDGVRVISDNGLMSWLNTEADFLIQHTEPIRGKGVCGAWNDRYSEALFTFKSMDSSVLEYADHANYPDFLTGDIVTNSADDAPRHSSGLPFVYRAKSNFTISTDAEIPGSGASTDTYWEELTPETNPEYFTLFTVAFDEWKNGWISFHPYWPSLYMPHVNSFLIPNPVLFSEAEAYLADSGAYGSFFGEDHDAYLSSVMNYDPNMVKIMDAVQVVSHISPSRFDFYTRDSQSDSATFLSRVDHYYSPIRNKLSAGVTTGDSGRLRGRYLMSKMTYLAGQFQALTNYVVKFHDGNRLYPR